MRNAIVPFLLIAFLTTAGHSVGQEPEAKSKIVSVSVFRNGLAVVKREVQVSEAGTYRLDAVPEPVHGTFWITSNWRVETSLKIRDVDVPLSSGSIGGLQDDLAGKNVVVHMKDGTVHTSIPQKTSPSIASPSGTVEQLEAAKTSEDERGGVPRLAHGFLMLKTADGYSFVNPSEIAQIDVKSKERTVKRKRPVLILTVEKGEQKPAIFVTYLTRSLGWAPSYQVDITDPKTLSIEMAAVIRNELADLKDSEIKLNFGYPGALFTHVTSPLSPRTSWDKFLASLTSDPGEGRSSRGVGGLTGVESEEMYFESLGKRDLSEGETLSVTLAKSKVGYERVVDWTVSGNDAETIAEELWDVHHFKNPFAFPMPSGPAMLMDKDQFSGQRMCMPSKVGGEASLRIRKSVGIRTRGQENELPAKKDAKDAKDAKDPKPELIRIGLHDYRHATVDGEMSVTNNRKQAITLIVRRSLMGKVLSTEGEPKIQPRDDGLRSVNPAYDIVWTLTLGAGEEKTVHYRFSAFILDQKAMFSLGW